MTVENLLGRVPDQLSLTERRELAGKWIAIEVYSPATLPLRRIAAFGDSVSECAAQLQARGLAVGQFEFSQITR